MTKISSKYKVTAAAPKPNENLKALVLRIGLYGGIWDILEPHELELETGVCVIGGLYCTRKAQFLLYIGDKRDDRYLRKLCAVCMNGVSTALIVDLIDNEQKTKI